MRRLSFSRLVNECNGHGMLMKVLDATLEEWFEFFNLWLNDNMNIDTTLTFVSVGRLHEMV